VRAVIGVTVGALVVAAGMSWWSAPAMEPPAVARPEHTPVVATSASGPTVRAAAVLRAWDGARAAAWARGSIGALRRLYVGDSGASDVRLLWSYVERGLRVRDLQVQVLAIEVLDRGPEEWRLRVTDRLSAGTVVGPSLRKPLPRDRASTRTLRLVRHGDEWRMAAVGDVSPGRRPAPNPRRGTGR
jgi:hypothetical protein